MYDLLKDKQVQRTNFVPINWPVSFWYESGSSSDLK